MTKLVIRMTETSPRTLPIALVLAGATVISVAVYGYEFGQHPDFGLTISLVLLGFVAFLLGGVLYVWERDRYYKDRLEPHL